MAVPNSKTDDALLKNLVPLNTLSDEQLGNLLSRVVVEKVKKGQYLFREGDTDHQNIYLLSGTIALLSGQKEMDLVSSGTQTARFALAHQLPRKHSAQAKTAVTYVRIDSRMLSDMLARSHSASYEVNDIEEPSGGDWMSLLLQSSVFQQIPPANLQRVMMRMEEVGVKAGDVVINQGDEGDFFYLISKGECSVTRTPEAGHAPVELAKLRVGKGFGEEALISDKPRSSTVTMLTDGVLVRLSKRDFIDLVKQPLSHTVTYEKACANVEDGALWLDVRTPEEYEAGHLPGAINLPFFSLRFQASSLTMDRPYMVYGAEVGQSATAAYLLTERGAEVFVLDTGWAELAVQMGIEQQEDEPPSNNVIDFNRDSEESAALSNAQQVEIDKLKKMLLETEQQFEEELKQRQTEIKLLKQALAVAKQRQESDEEGSHATQEELQHEIEALRTSLATAEAAAAEVDTIRSDLERYKGLEERLSAVQGELESTRKLSDEFRQQDVDLQTQLKELQSRHETQQGRLKEEITELQLQLETAREQQQGDQLQTQQKQDEFERVAAELAELQESSETFRKQSADDLARLSGERFDLECSLQKLEEERDTAQSSQLQEIETLRSALTEAQEALNQAQSSHQQKVAELQTALDETNGKVDQITEASGNDISDLQQAKAALEQSLSETCQQLEQVQAEYQQKESALQTEIEAANQTANESLEQSKAEIAELQQQAESLQSQVGAQESAQQTLQQEKAGLEDRLRAETARVAELSNESQSLNERRASLEKELEAIQEAGSDAEAQYNNAMNSLRSDLEQSHQTVEELRNSRQQLEASLQQLQEESDGQLGELREALEAEKQLASDAQSAVDVAVQGLNAQLEVAQAEISSQQEKRVETEALLEQEHQTAAFLQRSLKTAEEAVEISEQGLDESRKSLQAVEGKVADLQQALEQAQSETSQLTEQLQQEITAGQDAWKQASESDAELQLAKQELASLKAELEQEVANLQAQLEHRQENQDAALNQRIKEVEALQQSLSESESAVQTSKTAQAALESEKQTLQTAKSELEETVGKLEAAAQEKETDLTSRIEEDQRQIEALRAELDAAKADSQERADKGELESAQQALLKAEERITTLKREISGLREVQLEMESQLTDDTDTEISELRKALEVAEAKRKKVEKQAQQTDVLRRERQVQETAIEMLGEDMDALVLEKETLAREQKLLAEERDRLASQLSEIRGQYTDLVNENDHLHSEMSGFREHATDSNLADDLLVQMEELRIKADNYEQERDEAKAEAKRMRREVGELRSVIETYVEQIQDVQSFGNDEQLAALKTELDMVRRQAHEDLEQMRLQLQDATSKLSDADSRDVDDVADQQAIRQEMVSIQQSLSEKDHLLRMSQNQCRSLEDAVEDRDKEVDQLKRKLELLLRKTGGLDEPSMQLGSRSASSRMREDGLSGDTDSRKSGLGRLFRKK
ncbi:MAG: cyclic nucleotide-binding domain-containing protein [Candidatus Thiodiazotropha sp. (ex Myrtea sp. 'scaly one' KF741663)]|nr:cyclic nucleotide-binding domain-containing protein [Candidatus Thiodiazotropha sp. (ex Myrtea sp. 'scaly one' KF741663)]